MDAIVKQVVKELRQAGSSEEREKGKRFFKEKVRLLGVRVPTVKKIAAAKYTLLENESKATVFSLCEELWRAGHVEETWVACEWAYARRGEYTVADFPVFAAWLDSYVDNWGTCDTLCNHCIGHLLERFPKLAGKTLTWTTSPNRWPRRGAAVSFIIPARKGLFLDTIFAIADALLTDADDLVQKGYGWALKAASEAHCEAVFTFVTARHTTMPRTAYRYALEKMPAPLRKQAMSLH